MVAPAPGADWTITAPENGRIAELPKSEGEPVKQGDLLVRFEIPSLISELATRESEVAQAQAHVETAKKNKDRVTDLEAKGVLPRKDVEEAQRDLTTADAALKQAQAALRTATILSGRATITARFNGIVAKRWHSVGDQVDAATTDPVLRVIDPTRLEVVAAVPVGDLARVEVGRTARIMNPASGANESATIVSKPAMVEPTSATADVRLSFATPTSLSMGTPVGVEILAEERVNALVIPTVAILRDSGEVFVMVAGQDDNKAHKTPVTPGLSAGTVTQVLSGLKAGDLVIVRGQTGLPDGAGITVVK
jgi:RND family efflux transporter MFP subunit